jgi:hypothetical protein
VISRAVPNVEIVEMKASSSSPSRSRNATGPPGKPALYAGFDVIVTDEERIRSIYGFADPAPAP